MSKWLDLSNNANKLRQTYVTGFVDISGSGLSLRSDAVMKLYDNVDDATPKFSMNSKSMRIYDGVSSYYDMSNSKLLYLKDLTQDLNTQLADLVSRTKHITSDTVNIDTMVEFDSSENNIVLRSDLIPETANTYSLGSEAKPFESLYVNEGTIHFINPQTARKVASVSYDPSSKDLYLTVDNVRTPLNNTKYINGTLATPLLSYNGNVGIGTTAPKSSLDISGNLLVNGKTLINGLLEIALGDLSMGGNITANTIRESGVLLSSKYLSRELPTMTGPASAPSMNIGNDLTVGGNTYLYQKLNVLDDASFNGNLIAKTPATNDNSTKVATTAYVQNQGFVNSYNTFLTGTTTIARASVQQKFTVGGDVSLNSQLYVFDNTTLNNKLFVNGATFLNAGLILSGDASLNGNLAIQGNTTVTTPIVSDNSTRIATTAYVKNQGYVLASNGIFSGDVQMNQHLNMLGDASLSQRLFVLGDTSLNGNVYVAGNLSGKTVPLDNSSSLVATTGFVKGQGYASIASPTFTGTANFTNANINTKLVTSDISMNGNATAVTQFISDNSTRLATTAYVQNQGYAPIASPNFTGNATFVNVNITEKLVTADSSMNGNLYVQGDTFLLGNTTAKTQSISDNSSRLATTAYVQNQEYAQLSGASFTGIVTVPNFQANNDVSLNGNVIIQGKTRLIGNVTAPTLLKSDNSDKVATTAYVQIQGYAPLESPEITGVPTVPTAQIGTSNNTIASTEFVRNEVVSFINSIPSAFDAIQQLSTALSNTDASFATALANEIGQKANIASPIFTGIVQMPQTMITQTLAVLNDVSFNNNMFVAGDTSMNGALNITNPILSENSTQVATTSYVKGQGYAQLSGASFTGNISTTNDLNVSANTTLNQNVFINGNTLLNADLVVNGNSQLKNNVSITKGLSVIQDSSFNGNLYVEGSIMSATSNLNENSTRVATTAYVQNQGYAKLTGASFTGDVSFNSGIYASGKTILNATLAVGGDVSMNMNLDVGGNSIVNNNLTVRGDASLNGNLNVGSSISENGVPLITKYATIASPTFTGTVSGITQSMVGLTNVDNTSDASKPVSTAQQSALNLKANIASPIFTGITTLPRTIIQEQLTISGDVSLNTNLYVRGDVSMNGNVLVNTPNISDNSNKVATTAYVNGQGFALLSGATFTGDVSMNRVNINENTTMNGSLKVTGDSSFNANIVVQGITQTMKLKALGDVSFNANVFIGGDISLNGNLFMNGQSSTTTPATNDNSNKVATTAYVQNQGYAKISGATFTGDVLVNSRLNVLANSTLNGIVAIGDVSMNSRLAVANDVSVGSNITINKTAIIGEGLIVGSDASLNGKLSISGDVSLNANVFVGGVLKTATASTSDNSTKVATTAYVQNQGYAPLQSPSFIGTVAIPTANIDQNLIVGSDAYLNANAYITGDTSIGGNLTVSGTPLVDDNSNKVATTAYVKSQPFAPLASPTFTGTTTVSQKLIVVGDASINGILTILTSASSDNSNKVATTAYVQNQNFAKLTGASFTGDLNTSNSITASGDLLIYGNTLLNKNVSINGDVSLNGITVAITPTTSDNSTRLATTAYVQNQNFANLSSPSFTGVPTAPTALTNNPTSNQIATTLYVENKITDFFSVASTSTLNAINQLSSALSNADASFSTLIATELAKKANIDSPTFTGTVSGITKSMVDLSNVDNTSDVMKPVSTAQQTALNLKANIASPIFTGITTTQGNLIVGGDASFNGSIYGITPAINDNSNKVATTAFIKQGYASLSGANFTDDVSMNSKLYVVGDVSLSGNLFANYQANTIPLNAIIGGLGTNVDLSTNQMIGGIKTFINDVSMQSQLTISGNAYIASNNIISSLYQPALAPSATSISNLSKLTNNFNGTFITDFEIAKGNGYTLEYNITDGSLNVSNDGGLTWNYLQSTSGNKMGAMLILSPDGRIRMKQEYSGSNASLLYVSRDWGATYTSVSLNKPIIYTNEFYGYNEYNNQSYAFSHDGTVLYFIAHDTNNTMTIWKSTDNTFTNFTNNNLTWNYSLTNCPRAISTSSDGKYVLTITGIIPANGMYLSLSTNYGASFTRVSGIINTSWNSIAISYSGQYQVATNGIKMYQSSDYGSSWLPTNTVPDSAWNFISMSNDGKNRIACISSGYQYISLDYGATWNQIPNSLGNWKKALMVDGSNNNITIFAHDGINIYKSFYNSMDVLQNTAMNTDVNITAPYHYLNAIGKMLKPVKTNYFVNYTGRTPGISNNGQIIVLPIQSQQTIISVDYGETWNPLNGLSSQNDYNSVAVSGNGQVIYIRKGTTTYRSSNYGKSWTAYSSLTADDRLSGTALSYSGQYIVFAGQDQTTGNSNIYVSNNYGISWTNAVSFPTNSNLFSTCMSDSGQYMSVLSTTSYVLVSNDYGVTWTVKYVNALLTSNYMCMSITGQYQTVVSSSAIFVSSDFGSTFSSTFVSSSPTSNFTKVTMIGTGEYQYAVNNGDGYLYRSTDYGASWSALTTNTTVPSNTLISRDGKVMLYSASGDITISRVANYVGSISETAISISRKGFVSALDMTVNGTISTQALVVNQIYENGNLLGSKYAPLVSPTFTGTVSGITASMVGLGNVNNTSDLLKPVSTAQQNALNLKANIASPTFTGLSQMNSLTISQNAFIGGDLSMNGKLVVGGDLSLNGTLYANYASNTIPVNAIIGGIPVSTGIFESDIIGYSKLIVSQDVSFNSRLVVNGTANLNGLLITQNDVSMGGNLYVNGISRFNNDVSANNINTGSLKSTTIYSSGDVSMNGNLYVANSIYEKGNAIETIYAPIESATFSGTTTISKLRITQELLQERDSTLLGNLSVVKDILVGGNLTVNNEIIENGQSLITKYATLASPTFTGSVSGITKTMVGLSNVDNTSDLSKPISTVTQTAINLKANITSPTFLGIPLAPTATVGTDNTQIATTAFVSTAISNIVGPSSGTLSTLQGIANAINYDSSYSTTVSNQLALKAPIASPSFTGKVTLPTTDVSSIFVSGLSELRGDVSMNGNLVIQHDLSVNGNISGTFGLHSIPSTAISFVKNDYSSMIINTQRTDAIDYDDEFFETSMPAGFNGYTEVFYSNHSDLSLNGNLNINGSGPSVIHGDLTLQSRLYLSNDFSMTSRVNIGGDVSMNNNLDLSGSLIAHSDVMVYGVINQQNMLYDDNGIIYSEDPTLDLIKTQFIVSNNNVSIGTVGHIVEFKGDISGQGLHIGNSTNGENTLIGYNTTNNSITGQNNIVLGYNATPSLVTVSNEITLGNASINKLRCATNTITALSDGRDKKSIEPIPAGLEFIDKLNPVKFAWNTRDGSKVDIDEFGFIAQDLLKTQETTGIYVPNLVNTENPDRLEASYGTLLPIMIKAIQELKELVAKQQDEIALLTLKLSA